MAHSKRPGARAEEARRYRVKHPDKVKANKDRYRAIHLEKIREINRMEAAEYRKTQEYKKAQAIRNRRHKAKILALQEQVAGRARPRHCELCGRNGGGFNNDPTVFDHNHKTGKFRGWLCHWCNRTLGMVNDDVVLLRKMVTYLEQGGYRNGEKVDTRNGNEEGCASLSTWDSAGPKDSSIYS